MYEDGRCYSHLSHKFLKPSIDGLGYCRYTLFNNDGKEVIKVHRLVAKLFLPYNDKWQELMVNHKDGNKQNNHYKNLEWCTSYENNLHARLNNLNNISESNRKRWKNKEWVEKMKKKMSIYVNNAHTHNPNFKYFITDNNNNNYTRTELATLLELSQSRTDTIIRLASRGEIHPLLKKHKIKVTNIKQNKSQSTIENIE